MKEYTIAFVGNPNVGKSAWINALSHADFKIGNWPGVTIERKEATVTWQDDSYHLIDLPGTYSLDDITNEEIITSQYLKQEKVDCIVNVVDATNLQRNLYLTLLLRELQVPMILLLNFMDEADRYHIHIEIQKLSRRLQIPVIAASAYDASKYEHVQQEIIDQSGKAVFYYPLLPDVDYEKYVALFHYVEQHIPHFLKLEDKQICDMITKIREGDRETALQFRTWGIDEEKLKQKLEPFGEAVMKEKRYEVIHSLMKYVKENEDLRLEKTRRIDKLLLHRFWGLPLFFLLFSLLLLFVFHGSAPLNDFIDYTVHEYISKYVYLLLSWAPKVLRELVVNGIIAGVGGVLVFIPLMAFLYLMLAILEESGYMSRIAFLLDRAMRNFHLSGKSFVSLLIGFGCNVPAVYATRTLDNERQKKLTAVLIPFMSCGARLPVYVLFAAAFFKQKAGLMIVTVYAIGILLALLLAMIFSRFQTFQDHDLFVLELPPYRVPKLKTVFHKVKLEVKGYIKKATNVVLWAMILIWVISYFPKGNIESSYIASFGRSASVLYQPLGFGTRWETVASLPGSVIAKETVVGFLDQVLLKTKSDVTYEWNLWEDTRTLAVKLGSAVKDSAVNMVTIGGYEKQSDSLVHAISELWTDRLAKLRAFCFMLYVLLSIPCVMTLNAIYREYGRKLLLISISTMLIVPYLTAFFIFQIFSLIL